MSALWMCLCFVCVLCMSVFCVLFVLCAYLCFVLFIPYNAFRIPNHSPYHGMNNWNTMSIAINARLWAKTKLIIIAVNILGAAEGLRPKAFILADEPKAKTKQGPKIHSPKIIIKAKFLSISYNPVGTGHVLSSNKI